jgi:hypothetical protein
LRTTIALTILLIQSTKGVGYSTRGGNLCEAIIIETRHAQPFLVTFVADAKSNCQPIANIIIILII